VRSLLVSTFCFSGRKREWHFALLASQCFCPSMHVAKKLKVKRIHHGTLSIVFRYSLKWKGKWSEFQPIQRIHFSACTLQVSFVHAFGFKIQFISSGNRFTLVLVSLMWLIGPVWQSSQSSLLNPGGALPNSLLSWFCEVNLWNERLGVEKVASLDLPHAQPLYA
jgi:hypothetical protein